MPECESCGAHISEKYARVCGDNDDRVSACPNCPGTCGGDWHLRDTAPPQHAVATTDGGETAESN
jgi:hypothetical protein